MTGRLFVFGLGYCGARVAGAAQTRGWEVAGTARRADRRPHLAAAGVAAHLFDRGTALVDPERVLAGATHVLSTVPPDEWGDPVLDAHAADIAGLPHLRWVGYLSSTAVYGDRGGDWVDESSELRPAGARGQRRVRAEGAWFTFVRQNLPAHIFRLAGVYGPGRSAIDSLRGGTARRLNAAGQVFSRVHVDDVIRALEASMARPRAGGIYNLCDDEPASAADVVTHAAELLGIPPPPPVRLEDADLSEMARSFYGECKRVRNDRMKEELGVALRFPDYRAGLLSILRTDGPGTA